MHRLVVVGMSVLLLVACGAWVKAKPVGITTTSSPSSPTSGGATPTTTAIPVAPPTTAASEAKKYVANVSAADGYKWQIGAEVASLPKFEKSEENGADTPAIAYVTLGSASVTFTNMLTDRPGDLARYLNPSVQVVGYWPAAACVGEEALVKLGDQQLCARTIADTEFDFDPVPPGESRSYEMAGKDYRDGTSPVADVGAVTQGLAALSGPPLYVTVQGQPPAELLHLCSGKEPVPAPLAIWDYSTAKPVGCQ